jgi:acyl-CoA thioesterase
MSENARANRIKDMQSFEEATSWERVDVQRFRGQVDPVWGQGRAVYGGIVGAGMARAMTQLVPAEKQLRSFSATFVGPVEDGVVECSAELMREGRSASFASSEITQGGTKRVVANATFGLARDSSLHLPGPARPELPPVESAKSMPYIDGVMPSFTQRLEFRYARGNFPFAGSDESRIQGWVRFRADTGPADAPALLALIDAWPAPALQMMKGFAPASSITWNVNLSGPRPDAQIDQWWCFDLRTVFVADGYTSFEASMWAPDGQYVARSNQLVGVFG